MPRGDMRSLPVARGAGEVSPEILVRLVLWAILLGVPMVLLFLFGLWNGRRGASWSLLAVRSCLGSLLLSWTYMQMRPIPIPAWYLITLEIALGGNFEDPEHVIPLPRPRIAAASTAGAYLVGGVLGRTLRLGAEVGVAVAHALLRAAYHVLADHAVYRELGVSRCRGCRRRQRPASLLAPLTPLTK